MEREPLFKTDDLNSGSQGAILYSSINLGPDYGSIHSLMGELSAAQQLNMQVLYIFNLVLSEISPWPNILWHLKTNNFQ